VAVVIGAMIVAPLMGPLLGAGLALVQGNLNLIRNSVFVALCGIGIGLCISLFFGVINPGFEPTMEVEARGNPDVFDLFIALASGMVAAYAQGRPNVSSTLAGVAVAAALLPPIAAAGIAATGGYFEIAANAAVLLVTNLVAIVLGAGIIFRLLGVRVTPRATGLPGWARRAEAGLVLVAIILLVPLLLEMGGMDKYSRGQLRPNAYPVSKRVSDAVKEYVADQSNMRIVTMGRYSVEPESSITIVLSTVDPAPREFPSELARVVRTARGANPQNESKKEGAAIRIFTMQEAPILIE